MLPSHAALPTATHARAAVAAAGRIVVKLGTNVVLDDAGAIAERRLAGIVESLAVLRRQGREVLLVTSGAVALGAARLPDGSAQVRAAVGQGRLVAFYQAAFARVGLDVAQLLLTEDDFRHPARAARLGATIDGLLALGIVPVVNENDAVSTAGGRGDDDALLFRDNDMLAALVARRAGASLLVLLSDVDGVCTHDPAHVRDASVISAIDGLTPAILDAARGSGRRGRGGMAAKLQAAARAAAGGIDAVIANGHRADVLARIVAGETVGTLVRAGVAA